MESHAQDVENVSQRGFFVSRETVGCQRTRASKRDVPSFFLGEQNAEILFLTEVLPLPHRQLVRRVLSCVIACMDFGDTQTSQLVTIERVRPPGLLAIF